MRLDRLKNYLVNPLLLGSTLMIGGSMGVNVINYVYHLVMGRLLGPADYGVVARIFSLLYVVSIVPISSSFAIVKFISEAKTGEASVAVYRAISKFGWKLGGIFGVAVVLLSPLIAKFLNIATPIPVALVGGVLFLSLITLVNQATLQGLLKFGGVVWPNAVSSIAKLALGLVAVWVGMQVVGVIGAVVVSVLLAYLLSYRLLPIEYKSTSKGTDFDLGSFLKFSFPVLVQSLAFTSLFTADVILVKHYFPPTVAGWYAALSMLGKIIYFATQPISAVMFPYVVQKISSGKSYLLILGMSFTLTAIVSFIILGAYFLFPDLAIGLLYGSKYLDIRPELVWMGWFMSLYCLNYFLVTFFLAVGRIKVIIWPVIAAVAQIVAIVIWHRSLHQVVLVSLVIMGGLLLPLLWSLWRNPKA